MNPDKLWNLHENTLHDGVSTGVAETFGQILVNMTMVAVYSILFGSIKIGAFVLFWSKIHRHNLNEMDKNRGSMHLQMLDFSNSCSMAKISAQTTTTPDCVPFVQKPKIAFLVKTNQHAVIHDDEEEDAAVTTYAACRTDLSPSVREPSSLNGTKPMLYPS